MKKIGGIIDSYAQIFFILNPNLNATKQNYKAD